MAMKLGSRAHRAQVDTPAHAPACLPLAEAIITDQGAFVQ